ncbi:MAG: hypothetical protein HQK64_10465 [Desulfamplus sp.]|nr:hypothetical protein [Desulfamplus sp.]
MTTFDRLLDIYFRKILELSALAPPPKSYKFLKFSGDIFRQFDKYDPGMGQASILLNSANNIANAGIATFKDAKEIVREYLKFESRFVLENIWIRRENSRYILKSFCQKDVKSLNNILNRQNCVVVCAHTSGLYTIVELLRVIGHQSPFILMNMLKQPWDKATPLQRSVIKTIPSWVEHQELFFVEDGSVMKKSRESLNCGRSILVAPDVPGYDQKGVIVNFMGNKIVSGAGAAKLASSCNVPILVAIPYSERCDEPYRIFMKIINPTGNVTDDMAQIYSNMEFVVKKYPACWAGWLYLDKMLSRL